MYANPPTMFLPLFKVIHQIHEKIQASGQDQPENSDVIYLSRVLKRLSHWYDWYNTTQIGKIPFTYRFLNFFRF